MKRARYILKNGIAISPPDVDASTAAVDQLLLHITSAIPQLAMQGVATPAFPRVVPHLLGYAPIILPNVMSDKLVGGTFSYVRPYDNTSGPWVRSRVKSEATQFTIEQENIVFNSTSATPLNVNYFVYSRPVP